MSKLMEKDVLTARRAVEALRSGVPNRDAVGKLGSLQPEAETQFAGILEAAERGGEEGQGGQGMLVAGGFGAGKSHLLVHLEQEALARGFAVSRVSVSKETAFFDLGKVFASAMENGRLPGHGGQMMEELALKLNPRSERYERFAHWVDDEVAHGRLHPNFSASRVVHEYGDTDIQEDIQGFWAGESILVSNLRKGLKQVGRQDFYEVRAAKVAELAPQRLRFALELIKAVGYRGWVVLLDELELVHTYSVLQRGRAYAELARWMGRTAGETYPGLVVVGAVTDDFATEVISPDGTKKDWDYVGEKLKNSARHSGLVDRAVIGMQLLLEQCTLLRQPEARELDGTLRKLRELHSKAYEWEAPEYTADAGGAGIWGRIRYKVRAAINEWDLRRLRPDAVLKIVAEEHKPDYGEDHDMEKPPKDDVE